MEWKSLSILAFICQLTVTVHRGSVGGTSTTSFTDERKARRASIVMCHPDQTFFCVNLTHYSPCIHLDLSDLVNTSFAMSREGEFYCGAERCCQVGADSPCTYRCQRQSPNFGNPRIPWNLSRLKKKKKRRNKKVPLTSEEVDRLNKIVSVKSFIIRQKDLEEWDDYDLDGEDNAFRWRPSYRTFCPLKKSSFHNLVIDECKTATTNYEFENNTNNRVTQLITSTLKPSTTTSLKTSTTTTLKPTAKITTKISTTSATSKPTPNPTTKKSTPRWTTQQITKYTTKPLRSTKPSTKRKLTKTTTKRKTTREKKKTKATTKGRPRIPPTKANKILSNSFPCNATYLNKRTFVAGSCEAYFECTKLRRRYNWKIFHCKNNYFFDSGTSQCTRTRNANCDIVNPDSQAARGKRWNERIGQD